MSHHKREMSLTRRVFVSLTLMFVTLLCGPAAFASANCSEASFRLAQHFDTFSQPQAFVLADFNGDGRPDLAAAGFEDVGLRLNDGTGWFGVPTPVGAGDFPGGLDAGDFNGDGRTDLVVPHFTGSHVSLLLGNGAGGFAAPVNFEVGARTFAAVAADFNGDGKLDVAVSYLGPGEAGFVSVLLGDGAGGLSLAGAAQARGIHGSLAPADFNKDGKRDLALTTTGGTLVLLGDGAGGFAPPRNVIAGSARHLAAADFNSDGNADLAVALRDEGITLLFGDGAGGFSAPALVATGPISVPVHIAAADFNADGKTDLAAVLSGWSSAAVLLGNGAGGFGAPRTFSAGVSPSRLAVADLDGDGASDLAVGTGFGGAFGSVPGFIIMRGTGTGDFNAALSLPVNTTSPSTSPRRGPGKMALADFNNDGKADIAVSNSQSVGIDSGTPTVSILLSDGAGGFTAAPEIRFHPAERLGSLAAADFNVDGKADLAVTIPFSPFESSGAVAIYLGDGAGGFTFHRHVSVFTPGDIEAADLNNDSKPDLVVKRTENFFALIGDGAGNFSIQAGPAAGQLDADIAVADFNNDSKPDVAVTDRHNGRVSVALGAGNGAFALMRHFNVGLGTLAAAFADFNGDGILDIAATHTNALNAGFVSVLLGAGDGTFGPPTSHGVGFQPGSVVVGDFNGDGKADIVTGDLSSGSVSALTGNGDGTFRPRVILFLDQGPTHLLVHDFNSDGKPDLAASQTHSHAVAILFNNLTTPLPCISVADATFTEGDAGGSDGEFVVTLSEASDKTVKVHYVLSGFPATGGQDFGDMPGALTFAPGTTSQRIRVPIIGDLLDEDTESFRLTLRSPSNALLTDGEAVGAILDNDPEPTISVADASGAEGNSFSGGMNFNVTLSAPSSKSVSVQFATSPGTASNTNDYTDVAGTLHFAAGQTTQTVHVGARGDITRESDETLTLTLSNPTNSTLGDGVAVGAILNDDPVPTLSVVNFTVFEGVSTGVMTVRVRLSNPTDRTATVAYATADGTARAGSDYVAASGTLTFNPGEVEKSFDVTIINDTEDEVDESFTVGLSNPTEANAPAAPGVFIITDNDGPSISIGDVTLVEGQSGRTRANFTLTLSAPSPQTVSVRASTANGTASGISFPADFEPFNTNFAFFNPGSTTATVSVFVNGDQMIEPDETFFVNLSQAQGGAIADAQGLGTITNDDVTSVQFSTDAMTVNEADGIALVTVTRVGDLSGVFEALYGTGPDTASDLSDFNASFGTLRFEPNETTKTITVFINNDALVEPAENFFLFLLGGSGGRPNSPSFVFITINSDDAVPGPNPLDDTQFFVRQHYRDFLNRDPDAPGLAFWTGVADGCGDPDLLVCRINVSGAFFLSIEFQQTGYLVERAYKAAFGDATGTSTLGGTTHTLSVPIVRLIDFQPDTQRISRGVIVNQGEWQAQLEANKQAYFLEFVQRQRFLNAFPLSLTPEQFVDRLNGRAGSPLDAAERQALIDELAANNTTAGRASVLRKVAEDPTLEAAEKNRAFVLMQYFGYLRRDPNAGPDLDYTGYEFWLNNLNRFNGNFVQAELVKAFISSTEYRRRFGQ